MKANPEGKKATGSRKKLGILPTTLGILGASFLVSAGIGELDTSRQNNARAEAVQTINGCRDLVKCTLGKISLAFQSQFPDLREVKYKLTGKSVTLGDESFKIGQSEKHGSILEAKNGEYFLATRNINNTITNVKRVIENESQQ